jgi:uncharacterized membrane protein YhiD involved in acid resistance
VIISDGVSVRGINTAATLWCAAAVGALSASGLVWQAGVATVTILAINVLLRPLGRRIDRQPVDQDTDIETIYRFRATTRDKKEAHVRALLLQSISGHGYQLRAPERADIDGTDLVEVRAELATIGRNDEQIEAAAGEARARTQCNLGPLARDRARRPRSVQPRGHRRCLIRRPGGTFNGSRRGSCASSTLPSSAEHERALES